MVKVDGKMAMAVLPASHRQLIIAGRGLFVDEHLHFFDHD
jgi:hypothetical protein